MKLTKLRIVQMVLSAIDSDEVTSIGETVEAEQVGMLVDSIYDGINGEYPWAHLREEGTLEVTPTAHIMKLPNDIMTINDIWYNGSKVEYIVPTDMSELLNSRDTSSASIDSNGAKMDEDARYWTSVDDTYITFDSYNGSLVSAHTLTDVFRMPAQMVNDTDYPDLPERFHNLLFEGATADAFYTLKGDTVGFNIFRNRYKKSKEKMDRWAKRVNRKNSTGKNVDYGRRGR